MADSIIVGQFVGSALAAVGACAALTKCIYLCSIGCGCRCGCACQPLFWQPEIMANENDRVNIIDQFSGLKYIFGCLWFLFSHLMMSVLQTPADILNEAVLYLS